MGEQPTTCMCGHPQADHANDMGWCDGPKSCGCSAYRRRDPITWTAMVEQIGQLNDAVVHAYEAMVTSVLHDHAGTPNEAIMAGFQEAARRLRVMREDLAALIGHVAESAPAAPPGPSLEALVAEIVDEGHQVVEVRRIESGRWTCESKRDRKGIPGAGADSSIWAAWRVSVEDGEADSDEPVAAALARLATIRELHAAKAATAITEHVEAWTADEGRVAGEEVRRASEASESVEEIRAREGAASEPPPFDEVFGPAPDVEEGA